jgi:pimeloyl-ACP methyl ester carboxylesterase
MVISNNTITEGTNAMRTATERHARTETGQADRQAPESTGPSDSVEVVEAVEGVEVVGARSSTSRDPGRIGRVVAGTLISGLVAAIATVAFPLAGREEHVITGSVLVTFALAWAMLAVLSERWTNQPQRWAVAPAVFMAVTGVGILFFAPTGNQLGWVWPPAVITLTIWMIVHSRRALRSHARVLVLYPVFAALMLSAGGGGYETYRESTDASRYPMPGRLIDVGGHSLHINCTGTGSPTVVLEPGLGEPSTAMAWITPEVATTTRVCVYDRAGRGWSGSTASPQDGVETATDLHTLLERAGEQGPYVLAGHSAGGIYVLNFAHQYPEEVAGLVLLDSMHPEQYTKIASWPAFYQTFRRASAVLPSLARLGVSRALSATSYGELPDSARDVHRAFWSTPRHNRSVRDEFSQIRTAMDQARSLTSLGDRPLVVVTAEQDAADGWMAAQAELVALSTNTVHHILPDAAHSSLTENEATAARSSQAILDVVNSVRAGTPVAG